MTSRPTWPLLGKTIVIAKGFAFTALVAVLCAWMWVLG